MKLRKAAASRLLLVSVILLGLHACASTQPEGVGHEGGIVGTGNQLDCSLPENKHKQECLDRKP